METVISNNWSQNFPFLLNEINLDEFKFTFKLNPFLFASPPSKLLSKCPPRLRVFSYLNFPFCNFEPFKIPTPIKQLKGLFLREIRRNFTKSIPAKIFLDSE